MTWKTESKRKWPFKSPPRKQSWTYKHSSPKHWAPGLSLASSKILVRGEVVTYSKEEGYGKQTLPLKAALLITSSTVILPQVIATIPSNNSEQGAYPERSLTEKEQHLIASHWQSHDL